MMAFDLDVFNVSFSFCILETNAAFGFLIARYPFRVLQATKRYTPIGLGLFLIDRNESL